MVREAPATGIGVVVGFTATEVGTAGDGLGVCVGDAEGDPLGDEDAATGSSGDLAEAAATRCPDDGPDDEARADTPAITPVAARTTRATTPPRVILVLVHCWAGACPDIVTGTEVGLGCAAGAGAQHDSPVCGST